MIERLTAAYSDAEIKALLDDKSKHHDTHGKTAVDFSGEWYKFGVLSDLHIGSNYTNEEEIAAAIEDCNREGCEMLLLPGDLTEGMSGRDGHLYELTHKGYAAQRTAAVSLLSAFHGPVKAISGNHDLWYMSKGDAGALIVEDICRMLPDAEYLGEHEGSVYFNGARVDLWHGEDGASYALSYRI
ncbi:MAG: metallophosphoesterase, partial [Planctomycetaceae bacterium]